MPNPCVCTGVAQVDPKKALLVGKGAKPRVTPLFGVSKSFSH